MQQPHVTHFVYELERLGACLQVIHAIQLFTSVSEQIHN